MENDDSTPTTGAPYKDTPEIVPSGGRMPLNDPNASTAASKRSRGARNTSRGKDEQRQGDTAPYEDAIQSQRENSREAQSLSQTKTQEAKDDERP